MKRRRNQVGESLPNVRIARRRRGMPPEVLGGWVVRQEEFPTSTKMNYIRKQLKEAQEEEPRSGWQLEMRGSERDWHPVEENPSGDAFLRGFSKATGMEPQEASEQWAAFSRQLSNAEIRRIERGGSKSGVREGKAFLRMYPLPIDEEENPFDLKSLSRLIGAKPLKVKLQKVAGQIQMRIEKPTQALLRKFGRTIRPNERIWGWYHTKAEAERAVELFSTGDRAAQIRKLYNVAPDTLRVIKTGGRYQVVGTKL